MFKKMLTVLFVVCVSFTFAQVTKVTPIKTVKTVTKIDSKVSYKLVKVVPETTKVFKCDTMLVVKYDTVKTLTTARDTVLTKDSTVHSFSIDTVKTVKVKK
jgi:hypothetical protein